MDGFIEGAAWRVGRWGTRDYLQRWRTSRRHRSGKEALSGRLVCMRCDDEPH